MAGRGRGRRPDPIPIRILKSTGGNRDSSGYEIPDAPAFNRGAPEPSADMSPAAKALWDDIAPALERLDLLKPEDVTAFTAYCECWATYREALAVVRREGLVVENISSGGLRKHPAQVIVETCNVQLLKFAAEFGLTPAAEVALAKAAKPSGDDDPFAAKQGAG